MNFLVFTEIIIFSLMSVFFYRLGIKDGYYKNNNIPFPKGEPEIPVKDELIKDYEKMMNYTFEEDNNDV